MQRGSPVQGAPRPHLARDRTAPHIQGGGHRLVVLHAREAARRAAEQAAHRAHAQALERGHREVDRKSTRLNSSHVSISYAVFCLKKKKKQIKKQKSKMTL